MSDGNRDGNAGLGLIAAVGVALFVVGFGLFLGQENIYARDYADASEYQTANADGFV